MRLYSAMLLCAGAGQRALLVSCVAAAAASRCCLRGTSRLQCVLQQRWQCVAYVRPRRGAAAAASQASLSFVCCQGASLSSMVRDGDSGHVFSSAASE